MPTYAQNTEVAADKSRSEIERTLERYGATAFMYGWNKDRAVISFDYDSRRYRIVLPLPNQDEFRLTEAGRIRTSANAIRSAWEQATRQRWRALALWIKAVLEANEAGITSLEEALQPFIVLPSGQTVGDWLGPQIDRAYLTGYMPDMLPGLPPPTDHD